MPAAKHQSDDPDDIFADSRMSFGDHIEELRTRLWNAIKGLLFFMVIGFVLDIVGLYLDNPNIGIGRPVFRAITATVEEQTRAYYLRQNNNNLPKVRAIVALSPEDEARITAILDANDQDLNVLSTEDRVKLLGQAVPMPVLVSKDGKDVTQIVKVYPGWFDYLTKRGEALLQSRKYLTTLSVQESFMVYIKVSLICGVVLGSPWIFYQLWAFVAAGLYPHERRYVHLYLPGSVFLFLAGIAICQFFVLPGAVKALLGFNNFLDVDPDIRLNEWLGFAIILPLVFGISFQMPLLMIFFNRIGMFDYKQYLAYWRTAVIIMAFFAAVITPTPDAITMLYLFIPMFGLYLLGIAVCYFFPPSHEAYSDDDAQVAV